MEEPTSGKNGEFRFQGFYSERDLEAMARFAMAQWLDPRIARFTMLAAGLLAIAALLLRSWPLAIGGFFAVIATSLFLRFVVLPGRLLRHARRVDGVSSEHTIVIGTEEIRHRGADSEQVYGRRALRRAVLTRKHLFLLFKPQGLLMLPLDWIRPEGVLEDVALLLARKES